MHEEGNGNACAPHAPRKRATRQERERETPTRPRGGGGCPTTHKKGGGGECVLTPSSRKREREGGASASCPAAPTLLFWRGGLSAAPAHPSSSGTHFAPKGTCQEEGRAAPWPKGGWGGHPQTLPHQRVLQGYPTGVSLALQPAPREKFKQPPSGRFLPPTPREAFAGPWGPCNLCEGAMSFPFPKHTQEAAKRQGCQSTRAARRRGGCDGIACGESRELAPPVVWGEFGAGKLWPGPLARVGRSLPLLSRATWWGNRNLVLAHVAVLMAHVPRHYFGNGGLLYLGATLGATSSFARNNDGKKEQHIIQSAPYLHTFL